MGSYFSPLCQGIRSQISLDLDGELSQLERAMVARHVERCAECAAFRDELTAFTSELRNAPLEAPSHPLTLPRLRRARFDVRGAVLRVGAAVAGLAIIVAAGLGDRDFLTPSSKASPRSAYLDSQNYESRLVQQAAQYRLHEMHSIIRPV